MCGRERWAKWYTIKHRCLKSSPASKFTGVSGKLPEEPSATLQMPWVPEHWAADSGKANGGGRGCRLVGLRREQGWKGSVWEDRLFFVCCALSSMLRSSGNGSQTTSGRSGGLPALCLGAHETTGRVEVPTLAPTTNPWGSFAFGGS